MLPRGHVLSRTSREAKDCAVTHAPFGLSARRPTVSTLLLRPVVFALRTAHPGAIDEFYRVTGLTADAVADVDARIEAHQLRIAWREAIRITGDPLLPLRLATALPPGTLGIVEYVARCAPTVGEAISLGLRYLHILGEVVQAELVAGDTPDELCLQVIVDSPVPHEACVAVVVGQGRMLAGELRPLAVEFMHHPAGGIEAYERYFGAPVRFGAPVTRLVLSRATLDVPLATADPNLLPILLRHAEELLARCESSPASAVEDVRRVLCNLLRTTEHDVQHVAARLGTTARSLQRRLKIEDTTFQAVRDELRRELAHAYLKGGASIAEVSFLLGFSEASALFRAFKRWTGSTPLEAKRRAHEA
jgi:AraC-like DNA-binding protein